MVTISLCMIVKNEEDVLERCLESVKDLVDEIVIVDTGSVDRTKGIASRFTERVFEIPWKEDFAWARNFSFSQAQMDYCLWMDADDVMTEENREKFRILKEQMNQDTDVVMMKYATGFDAAGKAIFSYYRERLLKRKRNFQWKGRIHEAIEACGKIVYSDVEIQHRKVKPGDSDRNLRIYETMIQEGEKLDARGQFYYGRELYYHRRWEDAAEVLEHFLKEPGGWKENRIEACLNLAECYDAAGKREKVLISLLRSLEFDVPRAEICCRIGDYFKGEKRWKEAIFWYSKALEMEKNLQSGAFVREECYDYLPHINLCICYDRIGDHDRAFLHHKKARKLRPYAKETSYNDAYFKSIGMADQE